MNWWQYLLLVNLYLVLFYAFYTLLLRTETFFQLNRVYLVASAILSFLIPLMQSSWVKTLFVTREVHNTLFVYTSPEFVYHIKPATDSHITVGQVLLMIYVAGIAVLLTRLTVQLLHLKRMINRPDKYGPFSFFRKISIADNAAANQVIMAHEEVHARQWHSADVLLMELISIINWFNPVVYLYRQSVKHIHEFIADSQAVKSGTDKADYALLLLSQTLKTQPHHLVNSFFNQSLLKKRIVMLKKNQSKRAALLKYGLSAPLFILMLILSSATVSNSKTFSSINRRTEAVLNTGQVQPEELSDETAAPLLKPDTTVKGRVFTAVEHPPEFKGGISAFYQFLSRNIRYPAAMKDNNIQGKVFLTFVVLKDGSLADVKVLRDIGHGAGKEAVRVIKLSPKWNPGTQNGRAVNVQYTLPVNFALQTDNAPSPKTGSLNKKTAASGTIYGKVMNVSILPPVASDTSKIIIDTVRLSAVENLQNKIFVNLSGSVNHPLFLLDGKEVANLNAIDRNTIESINVIKDATAAVAVYGDKGKNGVIDVKTKKAAKN